MPINVPENSSYYNHKNAVVQKQIINDQLTEESKIHHILSLYIILHSCPEKVHAMTDNRSFAGGLRFLSYVNGQQPYC